MTKLRICLTCREDDNLHGCVRENGEGAITRECTCCDRDRRVCQLLEEDDATPIYIDCNECLRERREEYAYMC